MLRSISWSQFITFLLLGIVVYYAYYGCMCQKAGLLRFFFKDRVPGRAGAAGMSVASDDSAVLVEVVPASAGGGHAAVGREHGVKHLETDKNVSTAAAGSGAAGKEKGAADSETGRVKEKGSVDGGAGIGKEKGADKRLEKPAESKTGKVLAMEADKVAEKAGANEGMVEAAAARTAAAEKAGANEGMLEAAAAGKDATDQTTANDRSKPAGMEKEVGSANKKADGKEKEVPGMDAETKALLQTAEMAIMGVKHVVEQAVGSGINWEEIKGRLRMVLSGCQALRGTAHVAAVNGFIERNCRASFALVLSEEDLRQLWGGGREEQTIKIL